MLRLMNRVENDCSKSVEKMLFLGRRLYMLYFVS